jgi:hypothetical protein
MNWADICWQSMIVLMIKMMMTYQGIAIIFYNFWVVTSYGVVWWFPRFWNELCMLSSVYKLPWLFSEDGSSVFLHNTANHPPVCTVSLARIPQFGIDCLYFYVDWSTTQKRSNNLFAFCIWQFFFLLWRCDPTRVMTSSFLGFSRSHTTTHHNRWDSSGRVIS